jgi:chaperone modulatory protein CbpM
MITIVEFCSRTRLERPVVEAWVRAGWLLPPQAEPELGFADIDVARARLISELRADFGVNDDGIAVVLHLLDQVHDLRRTLAEALKELERRPIQRER